MVDLVVVGAGFWGVGIALEARAKGLEVRVVDSQEELGASKAAAGIVCEKWYQQATIKKMLPDGWTKKEIRQSIEWLFSYDLASVEEVFTSYRRSGSVLRKDCYLMPSSDSVLKLIESTNAKVTRLEEKSNLVRVVLGDRVLHAARVVVAAGACTDSLLKSSGLPEVVVVPLRGRAVVGSVSKPWEGVRTHMSRPYTHWTARPWFGGMVRVGDTVERGAANASRLEELELQARRMILGYQRVGVLHGLRPVCKMMVVGRLSRRVWVAVGGHRVGLGLTGLVARRVVSSF